MLRRCHLCFCRCKADRIAGQTGFCELTKGASVAGYSMLDNEGPLVGQPTFGLFLAGCSLRCCFCYRSQDLHPREHQQSTSKQIASLLDQAADAGAEPPHFLGKILTSLSLRCWSPFATFVVHFLLYGIPLCTFRLGGLSSRQNR